MSGSCQKWQILLCENVRCELTAPASSLYETVSTLDHAGLNPHPSGYLLPDSFWEYILPVITDGGMQPVSIVETRRERGSREGGFFLGLFSFQNLSLFGSFRPRPHGRKLSFPLRFPLMRFRNISVKTDLLRKRI